MLPWNRASLDTHLLECGVQDHVAMNAWVLSNPLAQFCHNEQKVIARVKRHAFLKWDRL
jgi:hypothetical protein